VEWLSILIQECAGTDYWAIWGLDLLLSDAQVLELCIGSSSKPNIKHTALVVTRRALRKVVTHTESRQKSISDVISKLTIKRPQPSARNAILLGVISGVCARNPDAKTILEEKKIEMYAFYTREILGSRTKLPGHIANGLHDFYIDFTHLNDVEKQIIPSLEKGLLRAPEIILNDLVTPLFNSIQKNIDLSNVLRNNLLKPLLANVKSSNAEIRQGALSAFKAIISRCHEDTIVQSIGDEVLTPLKSGKLASADHRALHSEMLNALPISDGLAQKVLPAISAVAAKEASEAALGAETSVLVQYTIWCFEHNIDAQKSVMDVFSKGLSDKKIPARRLWSIRIGEILWALDDSEFGKSNLTHIGEMVLPSLIGIWSEINGNPLAAGQSGLVIAAFVLKQH